MGILTEQITNEDITINSDGLIKVRQKRVIFDDGVAIFERDITVPVDPSAPSDSKALSLLPEIEARIAKANETLADKKKPK